MFKSQGNIFSPPPTTAQLFFSHLAFLPFFTLTFSWFAYFSGLVHLWIPNFTRFLTNALIFKVNALPSLRLGAGTGISTVFYRSEKHLMNHLSSVGVFPILRIEGERHPFHLNCCLMTIKILQHSMAILCFKGCLLTKGCLRKHSPTEC